MPSNKYYFNNETVMYSDIAISYIKEYFANHLKKYSLTESYLNPSGHWGVRYKHNAEEVFISSGRGYLELDLTVDGQNVIVNEIVPEIIEIKASSKETYHFF